MRRALLILCTLALAACDDEADDDPGLPDVPTRGVARDMGRFGLGDAATDARTAADADPPTDGAVAADTGPTDLDAGRVDAAPPGPDLGPRPDGAPIIDAAPIADAAPLQDAAPPPDAAGPPPACAAALAALNYDFEAGPQGFTHDVMDGVRADWPLDGWEHGRATWGPPSCAGGAGCWGTHLDDNYVQCQRAGLTSPAIDLAACADAEVVVVFDTWYAFWSGRIEGFDYADGGTVEASAAGGGWRVVGPQRYPGTLAINPYIADFFDDYACLEPDGFHVDGLPGFVGQSGDWLTVRLPLDDLHRAGPFRLRFGYASGVSQPTFSAAESQRLNPPGWYIDNVRFELR